MALPATQDPERVPLHLLFPEQYEASKRMIALDFLLLGALITGGVLVAAVLNYRING